MNVNGKEYTTTNNGRDEDKQISSDFRTEIDPHLSDDQKGNEVIEILSSDDDDTSTEQKVIAGLKTGGELSGFQQDPRDKSSGHCQNEATNSICRSSNKRESTLITYQNSAYVQNLAEICHDILHDGKSSVSGLPIIIAVRRMEESIYTSIFSLKIIESIKFSFATKL